MSQAATLITTPPGVANIVVVQPDVDSKTAPQAPIRALMQRQNSIFTSKGFYGFLVTEFTGAAALAGLAVNGQLSNMAMLTPIIVTMMGGILALWGRATAEGPLGAGSSDVVIAPPEPSKL